MGEGKSMNEQITLVQGFIHTRMPTRGHINVCVCVCMYECLRKIKKRDVLIISLLLIFCPYVLHQL